MKAGNPGPWTGKTALPLMLAVMLTSISYD